MQTRILNKTLVGLGVLALGLAVAQSFVHGQADGGSSPLVGKPAPEFSLKSTDDKDIKLSDIKGNVVVLDFWATWCPPCRKSLPHIQTISQDKELADKGLKVLAVNLREGKAKIEPFMKDGKFTFTVPMDSDGAVAKSYQVEGIPTTVIVGRDGNVKKVFVGFGKDSAKALDDAVAEALKEEKPAK